MFYECTRVSAGSYVVGGSLSRKGTLILVCVVFVLVCFWDGFNAFMYNEDAALHVQLDEL